MTWETLKSSIESGGEVNVTNTINAVATPIAATANGILNIGEEAAKGNELAQEPYNLLDAEKERFNFRRDSEL